jgi:hypothetical protein
MSDNTLILKKLKILQNQEIWISDDVNVHSLYNNGNLKLIKGDVAQYRSFIDLTDEYLKHEREVYTGLPEKSYANNWSTYRKLTEIRLCFDGTSAKVLISIFEGNFYDGSKENLRWKGEFKLNLKCAKLFEPYIDYAFNAEIDRQFEIEEEIRIQNRKSEIREKLLSE